MVNLRQFNQVINKKTTNKSKQTKKKISKPKIQANDLKSKLLVIIQMKGRVWDQQLAWAITEAAWKTPRYSARALF